MAERLMSAPEIAEYLGIPLATIYQWRSRQSGPRGIKVGKHVRYRRADVEAWLDRHYDRTPAA
jgi:excisionase family DNA binding protein